MQTQLGAMQTQLGAVQTQVQSLPPQVAAMQVQLAYIHSLSARSWNATCGDGITKPYVPVPNSAGATTPPGALPVSNMGELRALNGPQLHAWCTHYGVPPSNVLAKRRGQLAQQLGVTLVQEG